MPVDGRLREHREGRVDEGTGRSDQSSSDAWNFTPGGGAVSAAAALAADFYDCPPPDDADPLDAYEPGTVLDPLDREVGELLDEITAWERSRP